MHCLRFTRNACPCSERRDCRSARLKYTRDTCAQLVCRRRCLYTREHASAPSLTPCTGRWLSTEWRLRRRQRCLYVIILIDLQTNIHTRHASAHSIFTGRQLTYLGRERKLLVILIVYSDIQTWCSRTLADSGIRWFRIWHTPSNGVLTGVTKCRTDRRRSH